MVKFFTPTSKHFIMDTSFITKPIDQGDILNFWHFYAKHKLQALHVCMYISLYVITTLRWQCGPVVMCSSANWTDVCSKWTLSTCVCCLVSPALFECHAPSQDIDGIEVNLHMFSFLIFNQLNIHVFLLSGLINQSSLEICLCIRDIIIHF